MRQFFAYILCYLSLWTVIVIHLFKNLVQENRVSFRRRRSSVLRPYLFIRRFFLLFSKILMSGDVLIVGPIYVGDQRRLFIYVNQQIWTWDWLFLIFHQFTASFALIWKLLFLIFLHVFVFYFDFDFVDSDCTYTNILISLCMHYIKMLTVCCRDLKWLS